MYLNAATFEVHIVWSTFWPIFFTLLATILHTFLLITSPTYICCFIHCMHFLKRYQGRRQQNWKGFPWRNTAGLKFSVSQKWIFCSCCCYIFLLKMAFLKWNRVTVFLLFFFATKRVEYPVITNYTFSHKWKTGLHHVGIANDVYSQNSFPVLFWRIQTCEEENAIANWLELSNLVLTSLWM